jgi:FMN phosphatase YigB (HAD superfamily)
MRIFFDGDRTLWDPSIDYKECYKDLHDWMCDELGMDMDESMIEIATNAYIKYERKNENFSRSVFPLCLMRTFNAIYLNEKNCLPTIDQLATAFEIGEQVYEDVPIIKPGSKEVLSLVKDKFNHVGIITAGETITQMGKAFLTGYYDIVDSVTVVPHKNVNTYREMSEEHPESIYVMIGDSIENDINPSAEAGWYAIHIKSDRKEKAQLLNNSRIYSVNSIKEIPEVLMQIKDKIIYEHGLHK